MTAFARKNYSGGILPLLGMEKIMAFPVVTPAFFKELVDTSKPAEEYESFTDVIVSPAAVEYTLHLSNPDVVRKLMSLEKPIEYKMIPLSEEDSKQFLEQSRRAVEANPNAVHYWQLRILFMNVLQNRDITFEKRILILNYAFKTVQGMIDNRQPMEIPRFVAGFTQISEYEKVLEYFKGIAPHFGYSLSDGISLLKSLTRSSPEYKEVLNTIYNNIGVSGPETLSMVKMDKYIEMRRAFTTDLMEKHSSWIENIMINYVWTYSLPYACSDKLNIWDNYVFFCALYNAVKVMISCYMPGRSEEDFVKAVSSFDDALRRTGRDIVWKMVAAIKNAGQANNGDMAILTIS